ncbi:MAG: hypothetical protein RL322_3122 [Pseudomonadota bacterium]
MQAWASEYGAVMFETRGVLQGDRPLALLLHGGHGSWRHWQANTDQLSAQWDLIMPDLPGYGRSCDLPPEADLSVLSGVLEQAIEHGLGGRLPDLIIGFSFGTLVASALAERWQEQGRSPAALLLVNPPLGREVSPEVVEIQARATQIARERGLAAAIELTLREIMLSDSAKVTPELIELGVAQVRETRFKSRPISRSVDLRVRLQSLTLPRFVILGERDPHQRSRMNERVPQYRSMFGEDHVVLLPGAHWLQYDCPDAFADTARGMLGRWANPMRAQAADRT